MKLRFAAFVCVCMLLAGPSVFANESVLESPISDSDREHWAYLPLERPALPEVKQDGAMSAIDRFIAAQLVKKELALAAEAPREVLVRRLTLDLTGLPPTMEEIESFAADASPDAYERLVDRLLASPAHGERVAQSWLDLARFAETDGYEHDKVRPDAWKYRDWVIAASNGDMPYDRFVQLQLAGDELEPENAQAQIATTFCLAGPDMPDKNEAEQDARRHQLLNEMAATVGSALLGLQVGCAQCHDHKYDPISQADFYRLRAIFEPAVKVKKDLSVNVLRESGEAVPVSYLYLRGDHHRPGVELQPAFLRIANPQNVSLTPPPPGSRTSQRRAGLARWITRRDNPLTSRVMANRVWQQHFGRGICDSPSDFGMLGSSPTHGELLDHLACELIERGWSLKRLRYSIVTAATYRQASRADDASNWSRRMEVDPANVLYSRFPRRRLEGETLRDTILAAAGLVNRQAGGQGVMPPLPQELLSTLLKNQWKASPREADHYRRSIYVFARRNLRYPLFEAFDRPDANASCAARNISTTASQSLLMLNSEFLLNSARHLAGHVQSAGDSPDVQLTRAYQRVFGRNPTAAEIVHAETFLRQQREQLQTEGRPRSRLALPVDLAKDADPYAAAAIVDLCLALLNSNEFAYLD